MQAMAQDYPTRPLRLVTGSAGGANDLITRVIAQGLSAALGQPALVENKPSGVLEGEAVVNAKPDGHTLLSTRESWIFRPHAESASGRRSRIFGRSRSRRRRRTFWW